MCLHHNISNLTGVVLAGGKSRRLGQDKALLSFDGENLLRRTARLLLQVAPNVLVVGRKAPADEAGFLQDAELDSRVKFIEDERPGCGPAGGIATALRSSAGDCLVLSCDLPFMRAEILNRLCEAWKTAGPETIAMSYQSFRTGKRESLVGIYSQACLPCLNERLGQGLFKISLMLPEATFARIESGPDEERCFFNLNNPDDLKLAKSLSRNDG